MTLHCKCQVRFKTVSFKALYEQEVMKYLSFLDEKSRNLIKFSLFTGGLQERGKSGSHKPQKFSLPCHILAFLVVAYGCQKTKKLKCCMERGNIVDYGQLPSPGSCGRGEHYQNKTLLKLETLRHRPYYWSDMVLKSTVVNRAHPKVKGHLTLLTPSFGFPSDNILKYWFFALLEVDMFLIKYRCRWKIFDFISVIANSDSLTLSRLGYFCLMGFCP